MLVYLKFRTRNSRQANTINISQKYRSSQVVEEKYFRKIFLQRKTLYILHVEVFNIPVQTMIRWMQMYIPRHTK